MAEPVSERADDPVASMMAAVRDGDEERVRALLDGDPSLVSSTDPDAFGSTPLIHATLRDDRAMVDLLLDAGADVDQRSDWWAGSFGVLDHGSDEMAAYLLERGATLAPHAAARLGMIDELREMLDADPEVVHARGGDGQTPLHFARTIEIADLLLERGADIDARDVDHESTPAQWMGHRPEVAAHLVARGADCDPFLAARIGDVARLETLVEQEPDGVRASITRHRFPTTPPAAAHIYHFNIGEHCTLVHTAASANQPDAVTWLIERGANPNARGGYDDATPLHQAAWCNAAEAAEALLEGGADIDARSGEMHENEPVGWAIVSGARDVVRLLLEHGCAIRDIHRADAVAGAKGEFRPFQRNRPLREWQRIEELLRGS